MKHLSLPAWNSSTLLPNYGSSQPPTVSPVTVSTAALQQPATGTPVFTSLAPATTISSFETQQKLPTCSSLFTTNLQPSPSIGPFFTSERVMGKGRQRMVIPSLPTSVQKVGAKKSIASASENGSCAVLSVAYTLGKAQATVSSLNSDVEAVMLVKSPHVSSATSSTLSTSSTSALFVPTSNQQTQTDPLPSGLVVSGDIRSPPFNSPSVPCTSNAVSMPASLSTCQPAIASFTNNSKCFSPTTSTLSRKSLAAVRG